MRNMIIMRGNRVYANFAVEAHATATTMHDDEEPQPYSYTDGLGLVTSDDPVVTMIFSDAPSTVSSMNIPLGGEIFLSIVLAIIIAIAIFGNSMVCLAISRSRTLREQVSNVFIVNLAITDLGCASLVMPFSLVSVWFDRWIFGSFLCDVACFFNYCFIIVSMLSLALISIDRHIYVVHPFRYAKIMTHRLAILLSVGTWVVAFIFASAPPIMRWVIYDNAEIICAVNWEGNHSQILAYTVSAFVICFMSPIVVMGYCYVGIYKVAHSHAKRIVPPVTLGRIGDGSSSPSNERAFTTQPTEQGPQTNGHVPRNASAGISRSPGRKKEGNKHKPEVYYSSKAFRSILVMILAYLICNTPFSLTKLIKVVKINNEAVPFFVNTAASWFGFINPCCNPIIYSILREDFRAAFIRLLPRSVGRCLRKTDFEAHSINSQIIRPSTEQNFRIRNNITMNIIHPSPIKKRSSALIEQPLYDDLDSSDNSFTGNVNANNAGPMRIDVEENGRDSDHPGDLTCFRAVETTGKARIECILEHDLKTICRIEVDTNSNKKGHKLSPRGDTVHHGASSSVSKSSSNLDSDAGGSRNPGRTYHSNQHSMSLTSTVSL